MMIDVLTMMWKELREYFIRTGSGRRGVVAILAIALVFSVLMPYQLGASWFTSIVAVPLYGFYLPISLVTSVVADAFAGERERHTLETLLASRLSDRSILLGKIASCFVYAFAISIGAAVVGAIVVDITHRSINEHFYGFGDFAALIGLGIVSTLLFTCLGIIISLRAQSVRQVQQTLGILFTLVFLVPFLIFQFLPVAARIQLGQQIAHITQSGQIGALIAAVLGALLVLDIGLLGIIQAAFRRSRLISS